MALLFLVVFELPLNIAHGDRITSVNLVQFQQGVLSIGFSNTQGGLISHVKVVWYVWSGTGFPATTITNLIVITHTGNYTVRGVLVIDVMSFDIWTNSTGYATLKYYMNDCVSGYLVGGDIYSSINHLPAVGGC